MRRRLPDARFTGVDYAAERIAENRTHLPWARFLPFDLRTDRLDERFDLVVCTEVLEHIEDDDRALDTLVSLTRRHLMLTVPTGNLYPLEAGFGHLRHYQLEELCQRLRDRGLRIDRAEAWGFPFMTAFKWAANLDPDAVLKQFGDGRWSWPKRAVGAFLTGLFYVNVPNRGPQLLILAAR